MLRWLGVFFTLAFAVGIGGNARAGWSPGLDAQTHQAAARVLKSATATLKTTAKGSYSGACDTGGYEDFCGGGTCKCFQFDGKMTSAATGKAQVEVDITLDYAYGAQNPDGSGSIPGYEGVYITGTKDTEYWYGNVVATHGLKGSGPAYAGLILGDTKVYKEGAGRIEVAPKGDPNMSGTKANFKLKAHVVVP